MNKNKYIKFYLLVLLFLLVNVTFALEQKVYILSIKYDNGIITEENIIAIPGEAPDRRNQPIDGYLLNLISFNNKTLYSFKFNFPLQIVSVPNPEWFDENGNQIYFPTSEEIGQITFNQTSLQLVIPYFTNGKNINIYNLDGEKILDIDIEYFSNQSVINNKEQIKKTGQKIQTYLREDKIDKIIKYIIYFILGVMVLILVREGIIKIMDKYRLKQV